MSDDEAIDAMRYWQQAHGKKFQRALVRSMPCVYCDAKPNEKCKGVRGQPRSSMHQERWDLYRERRDANLH